MATLKEKRAIEALQSRAPRDPDAIGRKLTPAEHNWVDIPKVRNVREARTDLSKILRELDCGETFIIKGPRGRDALVLGVDTYRAMRDAYFALLGELEGLQMLQDDEARERLQAAAKSGDHATLDEIKERYADELEDDSALQ